MTSEHVDVLIVGAGISGIGAAYHLQERCPGKSYAILEARSDLGGTWDLFRYPGIRSDSDMHTLGFRFRPWTGRRRLPMDPRSSNTSGARRARRGSGEDPSQPSRHLGHLVDARLLWSVEAERTDSGGDGQASPVASSAICSGYYRYDQGYYRISRESMNSRVRSSIPSIGRRISTMRVSRSS